MINIGCRRRHSIHNQLLLLLGFQPNRDNPSFACARPLLGKMSKRSLSPTKTSISNIRAHDATPVAGRMAKPRSVSRHAWTTRPDISFLSVRKPLQTPHPNFVRLLRACVALNEMEAGKQAHSRIIKLGFSSDRFIRSTLIDLYSKSKHVQEARRLFDETSSRDMVLWNVMVSCYALNGLGKEGFEVYKLMLVEGFNADGFTVASLLSCCTSLHCCSLGRQIHATAIRLSFDLDVVVGSALIDMYAKCGGIIDDARRAFDLMSTRNVVTWNSIIVGYGMHGECEEAMKLLREMLQTSIRPDELTLASILSSCADSAAAVEAIQVHCCVAKSGFHDFISIGNALISAYAKNGDIQDAIRSFHLVSKPDLVTWSAMVSSYASHGLAVEAIDTFEGMLHEGVKPDGVALLGLISACSHAGLVEDGLHYFASMSKDYQIKPSSEHYACLVGLLGRAGHLGEAYNVLRNMPLEPSADVLGAFIGACRVHRNAELAKWAADKLFSLEAQESANYMLMANIYAALGCWDDVAMTRRMMRNSCGKKVPGFSWIEIGGTVHKFVSNDEAHQQAEDINVILEMLIEHMEVEDQFIDIYDSSIKKEFRD